MEEVREESLHFEAFAEEVDSAAQFEMTLKVVERGEETELEINYNRDLFSAAMIERFTNHLRNLLNRLIVDSDAPLMANADGEYPKPMPGLLRTREF